MSGTAHKNNFDFLRLLFALSVMVTHSYVLSGKDSSDFLGHLTGGQIEISYIGVRGFFVISGYLILQSLLRSKDLIDYFWKRVLRLFPGLFVCLVLTLALAPFVYDPTFGSYWSNPTVISYFPRNFSLYVLQWGIQGVFVHNPYPDVINGSLWTICYEFTWYMILGALFMVRNSKTVLQIFFGLAFAVMFVGAVFYLKELWHVSFFVSAGLIFELGLYFVAGAFLATVPIDRSKYLNLIVIGSVLTIAVSLVLHWYPYGFAFVFLPLAVIGFGVQATKYLCDVGTKFGDMSYGIYIYGFPVQQTLVYFFGLNYLELMLVSIPVTILLGYLSWHLVEKHALKLKKFRPTALLERKFSK
jgi:peptidoglycan/LPS O-acetylase OafA/YrhL